MAGVRVTRRGEVGDEGARQWGAGVKLTGWGWFRAEEYGPEVRAEGAGPGKGDVELLGSEVGEGDGDTDGGDLAWLAVGV